MNRYIFGDIIVSQLQKIQNYEKSRPHHHDRCVGQPTMLTLSRRILCKTIDVWHYHVKHITKEESTNTFETYPVLWTIKN